MSAKAAVKILHASFTEVASSRSCPKCGRKNVRPSPRRGLLDGLLALLILAPFRCRSCRARFYRFSWRIGEPFPAGPSYGGFITPAPAEVQEQAQPPPGASILISDQDPAIRKLLHRILERQGYRISEIADPARLIEELRAHPVDVLITDLDGQHGMEIAELHALFPGVKIIVLSGLVSADTPQVRSSFGAVAVLPKPFRAETLLACIRATLESRPGGVPMWSGQATHPK